MLLPENIILHCFYKDCSNDVSTLLSKLVTRLFYLRIQYNSECLCVYCFIYINISCSFRINYYLLLFTVVGR